MTRIGVATALASILMLGSASFAGQKDQTFTGEITDNRCARMGSHQAMMKSMSMKSPKECALGCVDQTKPEQIRCRERRRHWVFKQRHADDSRHRPQAGPIARSNRPEVQDEYDCGWAGDLGMPDYVRPQ
jgi:hypothetical protein